MNINGNSRPEIEFAPQEKIGVHESLAQDFLLRIFDIEGAWISDESILWDFQRGASDAETFERIKQIYGVDVSDIKSGNVSLILNRIATAA
jgi:hypothetical protein